MCLYVAYFMNIHVHFVWKPIMNEMGGHVCWCLHGGDSWCTVCVYWGTAQHYPLSAHSAKWLVHLYMDICFGWLYLTIFVKDANLLWNVTCNGSTYVKGPPKCHVQWEYRCKRATEKSSLKSDPSQLEVARSKLILKSLTETHTWENVYM
jgi:hypothetical protein